jgi:hypothetical protein
MLSPCGHMMKSFTKEEDRSRLSIDRSRDIIHQSSARSNEELTKRVAMPQARLLKRLSTLDYIPNPSHVESQSMWIENPCSTHTNLYTVRFTVIPWIGSIGTWFFFYFFDVVLHIIDTSTQVGRTWSNPNNPNQIQRRSHLTCRNNPSLAYSNGWLSSRS